MKTEYIVPSIIIMDYELYLEDTTLSQKPAVNHEDAGTKYRGDGTIPIVSMDNDDEW